MKGILFSGDVGKVKSLLKAKQKERVWEWKKEEVSETG